MIDNSEKILLNEWLILQTSGYFHRDLSSFYDLENKESIFFYKNDNNNRTKPSKKSNNLMFCIIMK